jgi:hypothetical protein
MADFDENRSTRATAAFIELRSNLDYARDLIRGGRYLERLKVGAFDVADLYRAAWVQAVSALDHWVHRELYDRALAFALDASVERPDRFLKIQVPMSLLEDVHHHSKTIREAFRTHFRSQYGHLSFQAPDKIKQALAVVSNVSLWPSVAKELNSTTGESLTSEQVQTRLSEIVKRRNQIAHEADRDLGNRGTRRLISDGETTVTIDWLELIATAIMAVLGEPPVGDVDESSPQDTQSRRKWTRQDVDDAVSRIGDSRAGEVLARLLSHADLHKALFRGGVGPEPSAGFYYWFQGNRRSLWSLYVTADRPSITLSFGSIWPRDERLAHRMVVEIRSHPALDATLLQDDALVRKYPTIDLTLLAESPDAVDTVIRTLDLAIRPVSQAPDIAQ